MTPACPRCGAELAAAQEYCIDCGMRLPGAGLGRTPDPGRGWTQRSALALAIAIVGAGAAIALADDGGGSRQLVTATGGFATVPSSETLPAPPEGGPARVIEWPTGQEGWTIVLGSYPQTGGREPAAAAARDRKSVV